MADQIVVFKNGERVITDLQEVFEGEAGGSSPPPPPFPWAKIDPANKAIAKIERLTVSKRNIERFMVDTPVCPR